MDPRHPQAMRAHVFLLRELLVLERSGKFDQAFHELHGIWDDATSRPNVEGLDVRMTADLLLRCGALIGFLGHSRQIPTAQDQSRNLLTESRSLFLQTYDMLKVAECENYLALAYWRTGEINEAESWIEEALSHELPEASDARLYSYVIRNLLLLSQKKYEEICVNFAELEHTFISNGDAFLTGNFFMNFGIAAKNLGEIESSLNALQSARDFFAASGNNNQVAIVENNLSQLYRSEKRFAEAHEAIDRSTDLFRQIGDRTREGYSLDTKALIYFDAGDYRTALETVECGIAILGKSENFAYLTDTIATKAKIQLYLNDFSTATLTLLEAVELAKIRISEQAALNLIGEFEHALKDRQSVKSPPVPDEKVGIAEGDLHLVMPPAIAHFEEYHGVWINNSDLEDHGLVRGSLAVVVPCVVKRGDLVAVMETESDSVSCGFYDADFGIVCIEAGNSEPQLFSDSDVTILGKIVGVCDGTPADDGTMKVRVLKL